MYASAGMATRLFEPPSLGSISPSPSLLPMGAFVAPGATADVACAGCGGSPPLPHDERTTYAPPLPSRSAASGSIQPPRACVRGPSRFSVRGSVRGALRGFLRFDGGTATLQKVD